MPPASSSRTAGAATASDRRQPARSSRTNVSRPTNYYARTFAGRLSALGGLEQSPAGSNSAPAFLPALTHFTQAVDAFPKELIKHFSMFKEVEAKIHDPEHELQRLLNAIARQPVPTVGQRRAAAQSHMAVDSSAPDSASGSVPQDAQARHQQLFPADFDNLCLEDQVDLRRRQLFFRLRGVLGSMLPTLDEKQIVLASAKATKDRGLARMQHSYSQLDGEISDEARYGSLNHWAYADKEEKKKGTDRARREVVSANALAAAAQHVHDVDSIAAKSEARREAMLANKRNRHLHVDSDFDDKPVKKTQKRKAHNTDVAAADARGIGLGISSNGVAPQNKRKKTEKALGAAAAAPAMERSLSGALQAAAANGRGGTSPRATPSAENGAKRKARAPPAPTQRKRNVPTYSPPPASSPLVAGLAISKATGGTAERPTSSRARKNSTANSVVSAAPEQVPARRPSSSHSNPQVASSNAITELEQAAGIVHDNNSVKGASTPNETVDLPAPPFESADLKHEEQDAHIAESMEIDIPAPVPAAGTRAGRTSKTATPVIGTFPEIPMARSRSTRNAHNGNGNSQASSENNSTTTGAVSKRAGNKKNGQSATAAAAASPALKASKESLKSGPPSSRASSVPPEPEYSDGADEDGDEPRYCYCNEVSYGNMVACDNESCPREWFHLACVNMDKPPTARTKWFCSDECKEVYARASGKGKGGRPGSSRQ